MAAPPPKTFFTPVGVETGRFIDGHRRLVAFLSSDYGRIGHCDMDVPEKSGQGTISRLGLL
jgi:hypothetical protein